MKVEEYSLPEDLYYSADHSWAKVEDNLVRVGITDFMQKHMGEAVFFAPRPVGTRVEKGKPFGSLETAKWVGTVRAPITGTIVEVNGELRKNPKLIHRDPYGVAWMVVMKPEKLEEELKALFYRESAVEWLKGEIEKAKRGELGR